MVSQQAIQLERDSAELHAAMAAAGFEARRAVRAFVLPEADADDLKQTILIAVLLKGGRFDRARAQWSTFVAVIARNAAVDFARREASRSTFLQQSSSAVTSIADPTGPADPELLIDFHYALGRLPRPLQRLVALIAEAGSVAGALRASGQPAASFYRQVRELRMRLRAAGLMPPREKKSALTP